MAPHILLTMFSIRHRGGGRDRRQRGRSRALRSFRCSPWSIVLITLRKYAVPTDAGGTSGGRFHCAAAARRPHAPVWKRPHQPEGWPFIYQISDQGTFTFQNTRFPEILKKFPYLLAGRGVISLSTFFRLGNFRVGQL